jgi:hypothetical protein
MGVKIQMFVKLECTDPIFVCGDESKAKSTKKNETQEMYWSLA